MSRKRALLGIMLLLGSAAMTEAAVAQATAGRAATANATPAQAGAAEDRPATSRKPSAVPIAVQPDSVDLATDLAGRSIEELRGLRGAIEARHCRKLDDSFLRQQFWDYQREHCGFRTRWERDNVRQHPSPPLTETPLDAAERDFVARVDAREREIQAGQIRPDSSYDVLAAVNASQFSTLPDPAMRQLFRNGFVVLPAKHRQMFEVYEENDYRMIPNFVTVDAVLHLYHLYFDFTLRQIEEGPLFLAADSLAAGMRSRLLARLRSATPHGEGSGELRDGLRRGVLYFAVTESLLAGDSTATASPGIDPAWDQDFRHEIGLIMSAARKSQGAIAGEMDYTVFIPRGHYTRSPALTRYFRALMWLGTASFPLMTPSEQQPVPIEAPLAMIWELVHAPHLLALYDRIYSPTEFYVGPTDDITPALVHAVADSVCGTDAPLAQWLAEKEAIRAALAARNPARIGDASAHPQIRFMGMRYIPDSRILQELVNFDHRPFPTGLDIFAVMGVPSATTILRSSPIEWDQYWPTVAKLRQEFGDFAIRPQDNLYRRWIQLLRTINQRAPAGAPPFMNREPWARKNLSSSLASWAQLRHDTILYAKPSAAECGGGDETPRYPNFVEPRPDVFSELLELQRFTTAELSQRGLATERLRSLGSQVGDLLEFLTAVARKEVDGKAVTQEEYEQLRIFGSTLEYLTAALLTGDPMRWFEVQGPDRSMATAADVHTTGATALEECVGYADEIYALFEADGDLYICRGSVFSYYEFTRTAAKRLTDEEWQSLLETDPPPRPSWLRGFLDLPPAELPMRYRYSSGC